MSRKSPSPTPVFSPVYDLQKPCLRGYPVEFGVKTWGFLVMLLHWDCCSCVTACVCVNENSPLNSPVGLLNGEMDRLGGLGTQLSGLGSKLVQTHFVCLFHLVLSFPNVKIM